MLQNKDISKLIVYDFELSLETCISDKIIKDTIGDEAWNELYQKVLSHQNGVCQGCGYNPPDKNFLELHVHSRDIKEVENYKFALLCKTCHTLQHIDIASEKGWIKLVNSIHDQKKLIAICRSGNSQLITKLKSREVIPLESDPYIYASSLKDDFLNKRMKMKAVFGKNFPKSRLL